MQGVAECVSQAHGSVYGAVKVRGAHPLIETRSGARLRTLRVIVAMFATPWHVAREMAKVPDVAITSREIAPWISVWRNRLA